MSIICGFLSLKDSNDPVVFFTTARCCAQPVTPTVPTGLSAPTRPTNRIDPVYPIDSQAGNRKPTPSSHYTTSDPVIPISEYLNKVNVQHVSKEQTQRSYISRIESPRPPSRTAIQHFRTLPTRGIIHNVVNKARTYFLRHILRKLGHLSLLGHVSSPFLVCTNAMTTG